MATKLNVSENQEKIPLTVSTKGGLRTITPDDGSPYYVGARAYVTQNVDGATVTVIDKDGTTTANIYNGQDGAAGQDGADGADGADGFSPIATVSKSGDTATITITDKNGTTTASISDGSGGSGSAFVAEFGTTTYADVKDAYDDDAILICTVDDSGNTVVLQLVYFDATNEIFYFAEPNGDGWYWTELSNANGWDDGTRYLASTDVATQLADGLMSALDKQKLDGLSKRNIWYGTCSTSASSSPKTITTASGDFSLTTGNMLVVLFSHANSLSSASLQVDGGASKSAYPMDGTSDISNRWGSNELVMFAYDGTKFIMLEQGKASTTAYGITKLNNTVTSTSTSEAATANAVKSAYDNGGVQSVNGSTGAVTLTIPTDTSDLTNGAGYITGYTETDPIYSASAASGITATDITNWNGKYAKPSGGIPKTDLASAVQTSLGLADTALQSFTETDPVFGASAASGISSSDISNWNGKSDKSDTDINSSVITLFENLGWVSPS